MDQQIDARFDRVNKALATLVESIAKYNPIQGAELVVADAALAQGLEELQIHQQNHARIQRLKATAASLDTQIKDTLTLLAQTRKELRSTTASTFPDGHSNPIDYAELLSFASRISKTTLPNTSALERYHAAKAVASQPPESNVETAATTPAATTPAATTPVAATPAGGATPQANGVMVSTPTGATPGPAPFDPAFPRPALPASTQLPEFISNYLNPRVTSDYVPWPSVEELRRGALSSLAWLEKEGIDPANYDPAEEMVRKQREEEEARLREEQERLEREEAERRLHEQRERARREAEKEREKDQAEWRRGSVLGAGGANGPSGGGAAGGGAAPGSEKKQFQFIGDDDDESD